MGIRSTSDRSPRGPVEIARPVRLGLLTLARPKLERCFFLRMAPGIRLPMALLTQCSRDGRQAGQEAPPLAFTGIRILPPALVSMVVLQVPVRIRLGWQESWTAAAAWAEFFLVAEPHWGCSKRSARSPILM